ncbi:MAG: FMN-binding protein [Lachnospiraceae bacterium]|nr:FMN-binding protein [Lachnospiraceae bacterium]
MVFIIALVLMLALTWFLGDKIAKKPGIFYLVALALMIVSYIIYSNFEMNDFIKKYVLGVFTSGALGIAGFYIVMFTGCLKNSGILIKKYMKIRGELSILSCILMLTHLLIFGPEYILSAVKSGGSMSANLLISIICGTILLIQMTYLGITSIKNVRKKMDALKWKKLQKTAYLFYLLMFIHGVLMQTTKIKTADLNAIVTIIAYSVIFITYSVLKIRKVISTKNSIEGKGEVNKIVNFGLYACAILLFCLIVIPQCSAYAKACESKSINDKVVSNVEDKENKKKKSEDIKSIDDVEKIEEVDLNIESNQVEGVSENDTNENISYETGDVSQVNGNAGSNVSSGTSNTHENKPVEVAPRKYKADGSYTGSATVPDYGYNITVTITVSNDSIVSATADISAADELDYDYAQSAAGGLSSGGYSAVSGATYSSQAIQQAYNSAVAQATN